ncbi:MAG: hypothetical protein M0D55_13335 [Elusimicrobiota bacterium]|nr:MAG: hypothetical protein M0D55_13335 [Elusimicrobiota bacterium]
MASPRARLGAEARAALETVRASAGMPVWLVGGAIRDAALGRPVADLDLACADARGLAARLARAFKATLVTLDEENAVYRLALTPARGRTLVQIDVAGLQGKTIEEDLRRRDFTINALALPLDGSSEFLDPRGGFADLKARVVRAEIESNLDDDPLRLLRAFRVAAQLGFTIEKKTLKAVAARAQRAADPAPERIAAELLAALAVPGASGVLRGLDAAGILTVLVPELADARSCAEDYYGKGACSSTRSRCALASTSCCRTSRPSIRSSAATSTPMSPGAGRALPRPAHARGPSSRRLQTRNGQARRRPPALLRARREGGGPRREDPSPAAPVASPDRRGVRRRAPPLAPRPSRGGGGRPPSARCTASSGTSATTPRRSCSCAGPTTRAI